MVLRLAKPLVALGDAGRLPRRGIVVLAYHRVGGRSGLEIDLSPSDFERQMEAVAAHGVVSLDEAVDRLADPEVPPNDPVVVTFDDGTADFVDTVTPVLVRHGVPATLYLATAFVEESRAWPHDGRPVSWSGLQDACATGLVTIGSHTHSHALLDRVDAATAEEELRRSCQLIEDRLARPVHHFAYPKGVPGSPEAQSAVRTRFRSAAVGGTRPNRYGYTDLHLLARSPIQVSDGWRWFRRKLAGGMGLEDQLRAVLNRRRYARAST
jgi:peptidoglycan/xylan/chitin deacetylase (PgdA/CDA1 family)